jgi:flavin reductase (DIM6/NTAB) family NADH-FMN oxidoreductase RutF
MGEDSGRVTLPLSSPIWGSFFSVSPLTVVGTVEEDGGYDLAPKHMAMPMGWRNYFGFVCSPRHATQRNAERTGAFTVSYPGPDQVLETSFAASPRQEDSSKPGLAALPVVPASTVEGVLLRDAHVWLECELERVIDGFEENTLIVGRVVAASVDERAIRSSEGEDDEVIAAAPLLAYLPPGRFARIERSNSFPFPADFTL